MAMLHRRSLDCLEGKVIFYDSVIPCLVLIPMSFPLFPSPCPLPFPSPWKTKIWHCLALNLLYNGILMYMIQVAACEVSFYGYCGKYSLWTTGNVSGFMLSKPVTYKLECKKDFRIFFVLWFLGFFRHLDTIIVHKKRVENYVCSDKLQIRDIKMRGLVG